MWNASKRLNEPSTWAGLAAVLQGLKLVMPPQWHQVLDGVTMAAGGLAIAKKDPGSPQ
jgi:hypothetical protein